MSRKSDLAKIHLAKRDLGLDDESYREMLGTVAGVTSARDLDGPGRSRVLRHLHRIGWRAKPPAGGPKVSADRGPMVRKIDAMLAEAGRGRPYIAGVMRRMFGDAAPQRLEWCTPMQLHKLVAALSYDARRREGGRAQ